MTRQLWVLVHRYAGLAMTGFLVIVGLTGSLLAFNSELEDLISPQLFPALPPGAVPLDAATLAERAEVLVPQAQVVGVYLGDPDRAAIAMIPRTDPATGQAYTIGFDQLLLDPVTGAELGRRTWGDLSQGWINLMPFIYKLHYNLTLDGVGGWILGVVALIWTLDCFVGFYLTLPARRQRALSPPTPLPQVGEGSKSWRQRWQPAWKIKCSRLNFDLHRASGLWLWAMLFIFAWSSVAFNLHDQVYRPVMSVLFDMPSEDDPVKQDAPANATPLDWGEAQTVAEGLMREQGQAHGFTVIRPVALYLETEQRRYNYRVRSSLDIQDKNGWTWIYFDRYTGQLQGLYLPTTQHSGHTITYWLVALHTADVFGLPYRLFVCVLGLVIVMLSVTGVVIWWRKRRSAGHHQRERCGHTPTEQTPSSVDQL